MWLKVSASTLSSLPLPGGGSIRGASSPASTLAGDQVQLKLARRQRGARSLGAHAQLGADLAASSFSENGLVR